MPLACWTTPAAHRWPIQALAETPESRVATSLGSAINSNFKFMLVAFFFLNIKTLLFCLLHNEYVCRKFRKYRYT